MKKILVVGVILMFVESTFITRSNPYSIKILKDKPFSNNTSQSLYYMRRRDVANLNLTARANLAQLDHLIECLKSFLTQDSFDKVGFAQSADMLREEVLYCGSWVSQMVPLTWQLLSRFKFAHKLFSEMKIAIEYFKFYSRKNIGHDLVRQIIELNLEIHILHGQYGLFDPTINGYAETVLKLNVSLGILENKFRRYTAFPLSVSILFEDKYAKASAALIEAERCGKFFAASIDEEDDYK